MTERISPSPVIRIITVLPNGILPRQVPEDGLPVLFFEIAMPESTVHEVPTLVHPCAEMLVVIVAALCQPRVNRSVVVHDPDDAPAFPRLELPRDTRQDGRTSRRIRRAITSQFRFRFHIIRARAWA